MSKPAYFFLFGILALFISCAGTPTTHFYLLDSTPVPASVSTNPGTITLAVEHVTAEMPYSDDRLIFRDSVFEIQFYHYHRWVKPPEMMLTDKIIAQLKASQLCKNVVKTPAPIPTDFVLKGQLLALEEWDEGENWFGRVRLAFVLVDWRSHEIVWQQEFFRQIPVSVRQPVVVVQALNAGIDQCLQDLVVALKSYLK